MKPSKSELDIWKDQLEQIESKIDFIKHRIRLYNGE